MLRRPLRVALLCSGRAPGVDRLLEAGRESLAEYELVAAVATRADCQALPALAAAGVPTTVHDVRLFRRACGARLSDRAVRRSYDLGTVAILAAHRPDLVVLSSYLLILTEPMLEAYPGRIVNVHDSDLTVLAPDGKPRWRGLHSTRDAIADGARETRSTVHVVTAEVDTGPPVLRSGPFPVHPLVEEARAWGAKDIVSAYAYAHREWMMRAAWGDLLDRAARMFARGEVGRARCAPAPAALAATGG
ncbi:MAG TPA: formyltransferase family protein [Gemmatimonadota bacterium]